MNIAKAQSMAKCLSKNLESGDPLMKNSSTRFPRFPTSYPGVY